MRSHKYPALIASALLLAAVAGGAAAMTSTNISVHRCTAPDGTLIFTDKSCASLGASERRGSPTRDLRGRMRAASSYGSGTSPECAGSPGALVASLSSAAQANDINRVAALVDWSGAGSGAAHRLLRRLGATFRAATVDVSLESPEREPEFGESMQPTAPAPVPTEVRVDRLQPDGGLETLRFAMRRDFGCWWLAASPRIEVLPPSSFASFDDDAY